MSRTSIHRLRLLLATAGLIASVVVAPDRAAAQVALDEANRVDVALDDGTVVTLMGAARGIRQGTQGMAYHYLPTGLRLSRGEDGRPQFLFLKYNNESGDVQGGLLHFLMEWGLTDDQMAEAQRKLDSVCSRSAGTRLVRSVGLEDLVSQSAAEARARFADRRAEVLGRMSNRGSLIGSPPRGGTSSWVEGLSEVAGPPPCGPIRGAARVTADPEGESFRVISATLSSEARTRNLVSSGKAPVLPGGRIAVAADMDRYGAELLTVPFERDMPIGDLSLELDLSFTALVPAGEGRIVLHWDRLREQAESLTREWDKKKQVEVAAPRKFCLFAPLCKPKSERTRVRNFASDIEIREEYEFLIEQGVIELDFQENVQDERLNAVREAFFSYFMSAFAEPMSAADLSEARQGEEGSEEFSIDKGRKRYYRAKLTESTQEAKRTQEFKLDYHLAYERPFTVVQNVKSWYDDVSANYPEAMAAVNLNDPFFGNRTVRFRLDFDAPQELFSPTEDRSGAINYVTVQMRKRRDAAGENDFEDYVTIDQDYIAEHGLFAEMTFAEGGSSDPDRFEYLTQWSFGGGLLYPENPSWSASSTPAVTLVPPVAPRTIEVEGDLDDMEASDVSRITVQVVYQKFGGAVIENIPVSPAQGEPLVERTLFVDRDQSGYAYRLIVNHKTEGRIATEWSAKVNDDYVFAGVPTDLLEDAGLLEEAKEAAADAAGRALDEAKDDVLARFRTVLSGNR